MRDLVVTEFVTLDGVMEAPGGEPTHPHSGWVMDYFETGWEPYKDEELKAADDHLLGRVTYESFAGAWPQREGEFAEKMNSMRKQVVSSSLDELEWNNSHLLAGDPIEAVRELKQGEGGTILVAGSRTLVQALWKAGLIDQLRLTVFPVVLGSGDRLFPDDFTEKTPLELVETETVQRGVQVNTFRRPT